MLVIVSVILCVHANTQDCVSSAWPLCGRQTKDSPLLIPGMSVGWMNNNAVSDFKLQGLAFLRRFQRVMWSMVFQLQLTGVCLPPLSSSFYLRPGTEGTQAGYSKQLASVSITTKL